MLQTNRSTSPSHSILTPGRPVTALTLQRQAPGWVATGVPFFKVTGMTRPRKKSRRKRDSNPGSFALEADALATRPTRRLHRRDSRRYQRRHQAGGSRHEEQFHSAPCLYPFHHVYTLLSLVPPRWPRG